MIQSLAFTLELDVKTVGAFDGYRKKRSMSIYDAAGVITKAEAKQMVAFATDLVARVREWLLGEHPDLMP